MTNEKLNRKKILSAIKHQPRENLNTLTLLAQVDSTNEYLLRNNKKSPLAQPCSTTLKEHGYHHTRFDVCVADTQSKGRGRQGKNWFSPPGRNIYLSIATHVTSPQQYGSLSLCVGVMLLEALKNYGLQQHFQLKWPNDIYFDGKKLGGILIESTSSHHQLTYMVIGIGLNIALPTSHPIERAIALNDIVEQPLSRNTLLGLIISATLAGIPQFLNQGAQHYLKQWRAHDMLFNKYIIVKTGNYQVPGFAQGINDHGELLVRDASGKVHQFNYGDVSISFS